MKAQPLCRSCAMAASFGFLWQADTHNPPLSIGCLSKQTSYHSCFEGEVGDNWQVSQEPVAETPIRHFRGWATPTLPSLLLKLSAEILALCDSFSLSTREFFFDRSPRIFENILGLYRYIQGLLSSLLWSSIYVLQRALETIGILFFLWEGLV